ncbi:MAG: RNase adapter RapZ [Proteobacteria bacterium]|nr:RNase adapter RapZ [Pseudomonadota bacterium]
MEAQVGERAVSRRRKRLPNVGRVVVVTGLSGAGKTSALKGLEDLGYEAVDNAPMSLLAQIVHRGGASAVGIDIRTRDFDAERLLAKLRTLARRRGLAVRLLFLDCDDEVLLRRYTESRRRHPMAPDATVSEGIRDERKLLAGLRERADLVLDSSALSLAELRRALRGWFDLGKSGLAISVVSFSYAKGLPREADLVFDVRFLRNPHYVGALRPLTGRDPAVGAYIADDPGFAEFFDGLTRLLKPLLPRYLAEGKSYLTIALGCTGGRHRSVYLAERLAAWLAGEGGKVELFHRDAGLV